MKAWNAELANTPEGASVELNERAVVEHDYDRNKPTQTIK